MFMENASDDEPSRLKSLATRHSTTCALSCRVIFTEETNLTVVGMVSDFGVGFGVADRCLSVAYLLLLLLWDTVR